MLFSQDGNTIASASKDKTVKLWSAKSGKLIHSFNEHKSDVTSVVLSQDGNTIASASYDSTIKLRNLNPDGLVELGCNKLEGYLIDAPEKLKELKVCQNKIILNPAASILVKRSEVSAREKKRE